MDTKENMSAPQVPVAGKRVWGLGAGLVLLGGCLWLPLFLPLWPLASSWHNPRILPGEENWVLAAGFSGSRQSVLFSFADLNLYPSSVISHNCG